ncbi:MAG: GYD domain-containing protein [Acidobacteriia bacterium]|nr:GYD domain-containing protein [Terriglobia bacterium]
MAHYLLQVAYTPEAWTALVNNPQDRAKGVESAIKNLGGKVERFWLSFGDYDTIGVVEMPDSVSAAAFSMAVAAGGACKNVKTTPLLTTQEGIEAMKKAAECGYKPVTQQTSRAGR